MKKRLTEEEFQACLKSLEAGKQIGQQTRDIAHAVLVKGIKQTEFMKRLDITKGAVSQAVNRVWNAHKALNIPKGYEQVSAVLPQHQAYIVKKWAMEALKKREDKK